MDNGKVVFIGDPHIGASGAGGDDVFLNQSERFFDELHKKMKEESIGKMIVLGDMFNNRRSIDFKVLSRFREFFTNKFAYDTDIDIFIIVGNHDSALKNSIRINSPELLLSWASNIHIIQSPTEITIGQKRLLLVPWICKENSNEILQSISNSTANICCGHFDISGFTMVRGIESSDGLSSDIFESFERVFSGHFHIGSSKGKITYVGSPYQLTFNDVNDEKRIIVADYSNSNVQYEEIHLSEELFFQIPWTMDYVRTDFKGKIVKTIIGEHSPEEAIAYFSWFQKVLASEPASFVVDAVIRNSVNDTSPTINMSKDTMDILNTYINETIPEDAFRTNVKSLVFDLYKEAQGM